VKEKNGNPNCNKLESLGEKNEPNNKLVNSAVMVIMKLKFNNFVKASP